MRSGASDGVSLLTAKHLHLQPRPARLCSAQLGSAALRHSLRWGLSGEGSGCLTSHLPGRARVRRQGPPRSRRPDGSLSSIPEQPPVGSEHQGCGGWGPGLLSRAQEKGTQDRRGGGGGTYQSGLSGPCGPCSWLVQPP